MVLLPQSSRAARLAVPTNEHFLPLLYILALHQEGEELRFFNDSLSLGSLSIGSVMIG